MPWPWMRKMPFIQKIALFLHKQKEPAEKAGLQDGLTKEAEFSRQALCHVFSLPGRIPRFCPAGKIFWHGREFF